ncbi:MAG: hypothetical protein COV43_06850 [Deltaproteobacteria bacterium CG11_big_fil_rev_8_21_14_0_20_42_23]|nr:MAG: hypothetical protein COV43_06850 [Deltaproteobacteria bacterium CG11_big_fil_rev_8_21_14_0_20_42_23]PJC65234.1 MAG: hypothetical protein CO021_00155 [Deltaproteobacteria bacterium CG_4_9_14_0_2_um_filter_42_21]
MIAALQELIRRGAELYEVGGVVRDHLLGRETNDNDYLVRCLPVDELIKILKPFGKVALVGKSFGVIKFSPHAKPSVEIDFALPRKEVSTGEGHRDFDVMFDHMLPVAEDLSRRDFTINAIAKSVNTGEIIDPFHGQEDIKKKLIRMVFPKAFEEDPLRMLRAIQFAARLHFSLEAETKLAIQKHASLISTVSPERIIEELRKLLLADKPSLGFDLMHETGLLEKAFPEIALLKKTEQDKKPGDTVYDHTMRVLDASRADALIEEPGEINLMLAALFHDAGKPRTAQYHKPSDRVVFFGHQLVSKHIAKKWMQKMKVETIGANPKTVLTLVEHHMFETKAYYTERAIRRFIAKVSPELIFKLLDLRLADNRGGKHPNSVNGVKRLRVKIREELEKQNAFGLKDLAINGQDLMQLGIPAGPQLGKVMKHLLELVIDEPDLNTKESLLALAKNIVAEQE